MMQEISSDLVFSGKQKGNFNRGVGNFKKIGLIWGQISK